MLHFFYIKFKTIYTSFIFKLNFLKLLIKNLIIELKEIYLDEKNNKFLPKDKDRPKTLGELSLSELLDKGLLNNYDPKLSKEDNDKKN
jgi:hypothetical protein